MPGNPTSRRPEAGSAASLPGIPLDSGEPVFREPWEAQAFAMALALHERGVFTWPEWAAALAAEIRSAQAAGDPDLGTTYDRHSLAATVIAVPSPITKVEATPVQNRPWASANTNTRIAPEHGRKPTATMAESPRAQPPGPASSSGSGPCECPA